MTGDVAAGGFVRGVKHGLSGIALITRPGIRLFVVIPLIINIGLFIVALTAVGMALDYAVDSYLGSWPEWIQGIVWVIFALLSAVVVFFSFSIVANIVASPFNSMLSEAVERHLQGSQQALPFSWARVARDLGRTIPAELRKLLYIGLRALPLLVLSLIPVVNVVAPALWLLFGAWMLCLEYLDCPFGNHSVFFPSALNGMRKRRSLSLGFGLCITVFTLIPVLNFIAMPIGVAGATSMYCRHHANG